MRERDTQTERVANLSERILEDLNVDNGAVLAKVLAQLVGRRLPAETAHKELVVRQVGWSRATGRAALIQGQSAHCDFRFHSAAGRPVAIAIHPRSASTSVAKVAPTRHHIFWHPSEIEVVVVMVGESSGMKERERETNKKTKRLEK